MRQFFLLSIFLFAATVAHAQVWHQLGPPGGDVRALAVDPSRRARIFLGTADGHIFGSEDSGAHWTLLGRASSRLDAVITAIVVDPRNGNVLFASSWTRDSAAGGGVYRSADGGHNWNDAGLAGQAVRSLALAPSDPNLLLAGTLDGVYRSRDAGKSWERISPAHHEELRNIDSLAIDPRDPQIIYAGTFHLPWKTTDGGRTWQPIHQGMIDDSDVMSLLVDAGDSRRIFASACSGIYRSDDSAAQWRKIQGIPYAARRTYAITQDPKNPANVFAATSEGLWKTQDGGMTWRRTTPESWVVNTVVVAEGIPARVLIGTEERGVLASGDEGEHFEDANAGFEHRQILALGLDAKQPGRVLVALADSPEPIMVTEDDGKTWAPLGPGLRAELVLQVFAAPDGAWWVSLVHGGLLRYDGGKRAWIATGAVIGDRVNRKDSVSPHAGIEGAAEQHAVPLVPPREIGHSGRKSSDGRHPFQEIVMDMAFSSNEWYAATRGGLFISVDKGTTWRLTPVGPLTSLPIQSVRVSANGRQIRVASLRGLVFSKDGGDSWAWHDLPFQSGGAMALDTKPGDENTLIAVALNGLYISRDAGESWQLAASGLPSTPVESFAAVGDTFVASMRTGGLYVSFDSGLAWERVPGPVGEGIFAAVAPAHEPGVVFAASTTEGLYKVEWPPTVSSPASHSGQSGSRTTGEESRWGR